MRNRSSDIWPSARINVDASSLESAGRRVSIASSTVCSTFRSMSIACAVRSADRVPSNRMSSRRIAACRWGCSSNALRI